MRVLTQRIVSCRKRVTVRCKENLSGTRELKESTYACTYASINLEGIHISLEKVCFSPVDSREGS